VLHEGLLALVDRDAVSPVGLLSRLQDVKPFLELEHFQVL
jgi:hypothetical protein